ncbi:PREDICTED: LOW QUALITY PROTEIN: putative F-box protein At4g22660 [Camelina sativa]|uniref:LOW QUALITY PROTEIN: putative F-box protein At4g22660 n=1 Tax=Camelina sativa TaxID=90675 RepID=A0ABM1QII6_CAMSA|nr:PREDICTED: LOW QUALITY PROTEIN: putative F-box protein At4g22660 [Camelina sativa]
MEKNYNSNTWSELPLDLLNLVFERLSFANFQRAKSVCSSWHSASRQSVPKNQVPWLILFPKERNNNKSSSCTLFNPEEKDKLYKTQDLGVEFAKSVCIATYGSWLLMQDSKYNLYILNPFTHERIDLPAVESQQVRMVKVERTIEDDFFTFGAAHNHGRLFKGNRTVRTPVFWIDEETNDYIVLWGVGYWCVVYAKKGDTLWNQIPSVILDSLDMVYKDHKLYSFSYRNLFTILDFSGEIPRKTFQRFINVNVYRLESLSPRSRQLSNAWCVAETRLVVTVTGDVLLVERRLRPRYRIQSFNVYKFYSSGTFLDKYDRADSLGDDAILLDLGITVLANEVEGLKKNSIYFSDSHYTTTKDLFLFNYETQEVELQHKFDFDCLLLELSARWFFPSFSHT